MRKGQVAQETIIALIIVMGLFLLVLVVVGNRNTETAYYESLIERKNECLKVARVIESLYGEKNIELFFEIDKNVTVRSAGVIEVEEYYCDYLGAADEVALDKGEIRAYTTVDGNVVLRNVP
jgi:hypothetical protein